ncbi:hypothetical protein [Rhodoplanes sp. SY1]|uniref:hypothetical protein n=1 Tax=Rhodoplanes sp. SY1 TaxID=3166646 RepID=UPI0038B66696
MTRAVLAFAAAALVLTTAAGSADARPQRFKVFDQETGKTLHDDGKLDGKACVFGKDTRFNPATGKIIVVPAMKCNFKSF